MNCASSVVINRPDNRISKTRRREAGVLRVVNNPLSCSSKEGPNEKLHHKKWPISTYFHVPLR